MAENQEGSQSSGGLGGIGDKLSEAAGGSSTGANVQSYINKGIETVQQSVFGQGNQSASGESSTGENKSHHAAVDQAHPEEISEYLRDKHMSTTKEEREGPRLG